MITTTITESKCARCHRIMDPADAAQSATCFWCRRVANGEVRSLYDNVPVRGCVRHDDVEMFPETYKDTR